jgi:hypothetical protein
MSASSEVRTTSRLRVYGVDFSGAKDAGRKIWLAHGKVEENALRIEACYRADSLPGSGQDREQCLAALRAFITGEQDSAFGLDFPFSLPYALVRHKKDWEDFVLSFPDDYTDPEMFRHFCREAYSGHEIKRTTDRESRTPFASYNLRIYRQTYYGIRDLLHPLVRDQQARVLPIQRPLPDRPWVLEICPASTLKQIALYLPYKGRTDKHRAGRARTLERLEATGVLIPERTQSTVLKDHGGDALDSIIAAWATCKALRNPDLLAVDRTSVYALEGYVYV